ncbi:MAG: TonB-dependent receptor [Marinagarivorans sp.]|nr:TonB-dependent receptor [Marinagarivorans sp.]
MIPFLCKNSLAILIIAVSSSAAFAGDNSKTKVVEETFVTASRIEQSLDSVIGSADVVTAAQISAFKPYDLNDMLELTPSVDITRSGGLGSNTSISIRGASSKQSLVLINGQRFGSATLGLSSLSLVPTDLVAQMEVVRGGGSSLFGSDAVAGVVNVRTFGQKRVDDALNFSIDNGSHNYNSSAVSGNKTVGVFTFSGGLNRESSSGIDNTISEAGTNADDDGYSRTGGLASVLFQPIDALSINLLHIENTSDPEYDDPYAANPNYFPESHDKIRMTQLVGRFSLNDIYSTEINASHSQDQNASRDVPYPSYFQTTRTNVSWLNTLNFSAQNLVLGLSKDQASVDSSTQYANEQGVVQEQLNVESAFAQLSGDVNALSYQLGVRSDDDDEYGSQVTLNASLAFDVASVVRPYIRYTEGFRAPTFNELWYPDYGNSALEPESSENYEIGSNLNLGNYSWDLAFYRNDYTNLISSDPKTYLPANIGSARIEGVENTFSYKGDALGVFTLVVDYLDALNTTNADTETNLIGKPRANLRFMWDKNVGDFNLGVQSRLQSKRSYGSATAPSYLPGYGLVSLSGSWQVTEVVSISLKLNNIFDKEYSVNTRYRQDARNVLAGMKFNL